MPSLEIAGSNTKFLGNVVGLRFSSVKRQSVRPNVKCFHAVFMRVLLYISFGLWHTAMIINMV